MSVEQTGSNHSVTDASMTTPSLSIGSLIVFILAAVMLAGGFYVMASAFAAEGAETIMFIGGMLLSTLGCFLAFSWLPSRER